MKKIDLKRKIWKYNPKKNLGENGSFGEVFEGIGTDQKIVAIKRIFQEAPHSGQRELDIAESFIGKNFDHVISIFDTGIDKKTDRYFIVMEKADFSLEQYITNNSLNEHESIDILKQISKGLIEVNNILHRDLKPSNVLFANDKWKISDFGISKFAEKRTAANTMLGNFTPDYAAPEQWEGGTISPQTDVYALGCISYFLLTGSPPFKGDAVKIGKQHCTVPPNEIENITPMLCLLIKQCLAKNPEHRPKILSVLEELINIEHKDNPSKTLLETINKIENKRSKTKAFHNQTMDSFRIRILTAKEKIQFMKSLLDIFKNRLTKPLSIYQISNIQNIEPETFELINSLINNHSAHLSKSQILIVNLNTNNQFLKIDVNNCSFSINLKNPFISYLNNPEIDMICGFEIVLESKVCGAIGKNKLKKMGLPPLKQEPDKPEAYIASLWYGKFGESTDYTWAWENNFREFTGHTLENAEKGLSIMSVEDYTITSIINDIKKNGKELFNNTIQKVGHESLFKNWENTLSRWIEYNLKIDKTSNP